MGGEQKREEHRQLSVRIERASGAMDDLVLRAEGRSQEAPERESSEVRSGVLPVRKQVVPHSQRDGHGCWSKKEKVCLLCEPETPSGWVGVKIKYLDDKCLDLWRQCVHILWRERCAHGGSCSFIGDRQILECHHLIPRANKVHRHNPVNALLLCPIHHDWAEQNPDCFNEWMQERWPVSHQWAVERRYDKLASPLWEIHYRERIEELKETLKYLKEINDES